MGGLYVPRTPTTGVLYGVVRAHLSEFVGALEARTEGVGLPSFVRAEFDKFLRCGALAHGFARVRCGARRTWWTPDIPVRQWVLSVPHRLRYRLAYDHRRCRTVPGVFVRALLYRRRSRRQVTAFTIGHSLTVTAAVLGVASVPARPIEVLIALSVLVLAVELAGPGDGASWVRRRPWLMAGAFGLLHGFGFAGALTEAGLPPGDVPLALASFNVGIECGQLLFVAVVLAARAMVARWAPGIAVRAMRPAVYAMGITAAFWSFQRVAVWLG